jgi:serine/threonine protein phosphatase PrpC
MAFGVAAQRGGWPVQEDGYFVDPQTRRFVLADGFGGQGRGDLAAKTALKEIPARLAAPGVAAQRTALAEVNKIILDQNAKRAPAARGGASVAVAQISPAGFVSASNCGATAVALVRNGATRVLLSPQAGPRAVPGAALYPEQALGLGEVQPEARSFAALPGDLLFLASSGLDWESSEFQAELLAQWGIHLPGTSLAPLAEGLLQRVSPEWNSTLLVIEIS